jgi:hypothetical protein
MLPKNLLSATDLMHHRTSRFLDKAKQANAQLQRHKAKNCEVNFHSRLVRLKN